MRLLHNMASLDVLRVYKRNLTSQSSSISAISTGVKINKAKDDPSALAKSQSTRMQIRSLQVASRNMQDGVSLIQSTEGGLDEVSNCLQRMRELIVQCDDTKTEEDKAAIGKEVDQLKKAIDGIVDTASLNRNNIVNGSIKKPMKVPSGANDGEYIEIPVTNMKIDAFPSGEGSTSNIKDIDINDIDKSLSILDKAINKVSGHRGKLGGVSERLETCYNNIEEINIRLEAADSSLVDADIALEMANLAKSDVLVNSGLAIMQQTNNFPQDILKILQGI